MNGQRIEIGTVFGTYTVIGTEKSDKKKQIKYIIKCTCGNIAKKIGFELRKNGRCGKCRVLKVVGTRNHRATFLEYLGQSTFRCLCDCGKEFIGRARSKSCGCHLQDLHLANAKQLEGLSNGNVKILKFLYFKKGKDGSGGAIYKARCRCGNNFELRGAALPRIKSCGCRKFSNHSRGQEQGNAIYSDKQIRTMIDLYLSGLYSREEICDMTQVSLETFMDVIGNRSWRHIEVDKKVIASSPMKDFFRNPRRHHRLQPGQQYHSWTVLEKAPSKHRQAYWRCRCICGHESEVSASPLVHGDSKQCANCSLKHLIKSRYLTRL